MTTTSINCDNLKGKPNKSSGETTICMNEKKRGRSRTNVQIIGHRVKEPIFLDSKMVEKETQNKMLC